MRQKVGLHIWRAVSETIDGKIGPGYDFLCGNGLHIVVGSPARCILLHMLGDLEHDLQPKSR